MVRAPQRQRSALANKAGFLLLLFAAQSASADLRLFLGDARTSFYQTERVPLGLWSSQAVSGELTLTGQRVTGAGPSVESITLLEQKVSLDAGETLLWDLAPHGLRAGEYQLTAQVAGQSATLGKLSVISPIPQSNFLVGCTAGPEESVQVGATWTGTGGLYGYSKLDGQGNFAPDPLTPSSYEQGMSRLLGQGLRAFVWQGLWSGYVVHQPYLSWGSCCDPGLFEVAMQRAEIGAQQARRFLPAIASLGGMDEPGLGYGVAPEGKFAGQIMTTFPSGFERAEYERQTGVKLPPDPRTLPEDQWLKWYRWRAGIYERFFAEAKRHIKRVEPRLPFGQDLYASTAANDGTHPFGQRVNDVPTTHSFMFWSGAGEQNWNFALERTARRDKRFHFASNTTYFSFNNPDEAMLAEMVTNYAVMDGVGMLWHLSYSDHRNLKPSFERLTRFGDFINGTMPDVAPVGVLYSFSEVAMRVKEAGEVPNAELYNVCFRYAAECFALYRALRRAGFLADIVHEEEIPEGGLKGRKAVWLAGLHHRLPSKASAGLAEFVRSGGTVFSDATTDAESLGLPLSPPRSVLRTTVDYSRFFKWRQERGDEADRLWKDKRYLEASRQTNQWESEAYINRHVPAIVQAMQEEAAGKASRKPEVERSEPAVIWGKWTAGRGRYYCLLNDSQDPPTQPDFAPSDAGGARIFRASYWGEAKGVQVTLNNFKDSEAAYVIEGKDWQTTRRLEVRPAKPMRMDFEPTEMKIVCVLPEAIRELAVAVRWQQNSESISVSADVVGQGGALPAPVPLEVVIKDPQGQERYRVYRSTTMHGVYAERFPVALNDPSGRWRVTVTELLSGKAETREVGLERRGDFLRPAPEVQGFDRKPIHALLKSGQAIVVVLGDRASDDEKAIAHELAQRLSQQGVKAEVKDETAVRRKGRYPKVFASIKQEEGAAGDFKGRWKDLTIAEREQQRKEWETLEDWPGGYGCPPSPPDAFEVDHHLVLVGTDKSSTLIQALQRASLLPRVANDYFPGRGRGLLEYAWSPFALGKDVVLVTGTDAQGVRAAMQRLASLSGGPGRQAKPG